MTKPTATLDASDSNDDQDAGSSPASSPPPKSNKKRASPNKLPSTPSKLARRTPTSTPGSPSKTPIGAKAEANTSTTDWSKVEGWTAEKKEAVIAQCISKGASGIGMAALALEFGVTAKSMQNALAPNRPGNLRDKAAKAVRG